MREDNNNYMGAGENSQSTGSSSWWNFFGWQRDVQLRKIFWWTSLCHAGQPSGVAAVRCGCDQVWQWSGVVAVRCGCDQVWQRSGVAVARCGCDQVWMWSGVDVIRCGSGQVWLRSGVAAIRCGCDQVWQLLGVAGGTETLLGWDKPAFIF